MIVNASNSVNPLTPINARIAYTFGGYKWMSGGKEIGPGISLINPYRFSPDYYLVHSLKASTVNRLHPEWDRFVPDYIGSNEAAFTLFKSLRMISGKLAYTGRPMGSGLWECAVFIHDDDEQTKFTLISQASSESFQAAIIGALLLETKDFKRELDPTDKPEEWHHLMLSGLDVYFYDPFHLIDIKWSSLKQTLPAAK